MARDYAHLELRSITRQDKLTDSWSIADFDNGNYKLEVYGPNGFYRVLAGNADDAPLEISCEYQRARMQQQLTGNIQLNIRNMDTANKMAITITDNAYGGAPKKQTIGKAGAAGDKETIIIDLSKSFGWYDFTIRIAGHEVFERRYAGHVGNR